MLTYRARSIFDRRYLGSAHASAAPDPRLEVSVQAPLDGRGCRTGGNAVYPAHGIDRYAPAAGDLGRDPERRPGADCDPARAHPRFGSSARSELLEFLPSPIYGPAPGPAAPEGTALRTEPRRPTRTPGAFRALLPAEHVDEVVAVVPERPARSRQFRDPTGRTVRKASVGRL